jgi:prolyl-tRNA synthetase
MYSQWIHSYRDLPVLINQWCNVLRWEMRTRLFLRTSEFLWQEGHTAHETAEEAQEETLRMLEIYRIFQEEYLAIPVITGLKSEAEKFPGALATYTIEAMMQDGKALQSGTSHNLGQNFAKAFEIDYLDRNNNQQFVWTTSWGASTRMIGGLIMTHSDDDGLIIPPKIAPIQVAIVPIFNNDQERSETFEFADSIAKRLHEKIDQLQIKIDRRDNLRPADKFFHWIQQGVPVRIEVGPRDVKKQSAMVARRDIREKNEVSLENITQHVVELLEKIQDNLFQRALDYRKANTHTTASYEEFKEIIANEGGFIYAHWDGSNEVEAKIKQETKATIRCLPLDNSEAGKCMVTGAPSKQEVLFAISY